jgi:ABC-type multidrug transport system fused ATPase/permease subunit
MYVLSPWPAAANSFSWQLLLVDMFAALLGVSFAASVLPQVSTAIEAFVGPRMACYPAFAVIHRTVDGNNNTNKGEEHIKEMALRRGGAMLPKYVIDSFSKQGMKPDRVLGDIEFRNVFFHYPTRQENKVFDDFSLKIHAGTTVALVGFSGSVRTIGK